MDIQELKELVEEYQGRFDQIDEQIADIQKEIEKDRKRKVRLTNKYLDLQTDIENIDNTIRSYVHVIEDHMRDKEELHSELLKQLVLLIG